MQTPVEPFMQTGVQETYNNILLSTLLSLLVHAEGKCEPRETTQKTKNPQGQMSWVGRVPVMYRPAPSLQPSDHMKTETNPTWNMPPANYENIRDYFSKATPQIELED